MGKKHKSAAYVVREGRKPGIYFLWADCKKQVDRFRGAIFQGYPTVHEAQSAWEDSKKAKAFISNIPTNTTTQAQFPPAQTVSLETTRSSIEPIDLTGSDDVKPSTKRSHYFANPTRSHDDHDHYRTKKIRVEGDYFQDDDGIINVGLEDKLEMQEEPILLTAAQLAVVQLAMDGHNIFLTGAAGSGKTATLKEILRRLKARSRYRPGAVSDAPKLNSVQVVAPTGIAALPLGGKTTYSFAGWNPDSFQKPMEQLLKKVTNRTHETIQELQVIIIEEISMVENQFLERLNILMQSISQSTKPFGGKQIICLGDFHQLPPVKPFQFCLRCGEPMLDQNIRPVCNTTTCSIRGKSFELGEKWAFRAPIWQQLCLKHVRLDQIHRQKDTQFQDVLNKIRNGICLTDDEWAALIAKKDGTFAVKLMSRRKDVTSCNESHLNSIMSKAEFWDSLDSCKKLHRTEADS